MFNETAKKAFDSHLDSARATPYAAELCAEQELGIAGGMACYALFIGDISHAEFGLMQSRIRSVRARRVADRCAAIRSDAA